MSLPRRSVTVLPKFALFGVSVVAPALAVTAMGLAAACGGGAQEGADPKNASAANAPGANADPAGEPSAEKGASGGTTTTTTALPDGGDLQGAKLGASSHIEIESKGDAGPKSTHGGSAGEPGRTANDIKVIINARRDEARACYDKGVKEHPNIEGDLDIKWVIDPSGNVTNAQLDSSKSTILDPGVANCVIGIIKNIKFAASAKGYETRAHYPFNFRKRNAQGTGTGR